MEELHTEGLMRLRLGPPRWWSRDEGTLRRARAAPEVRAVGPVVIDQLDFGQAHAGTCGMIDRPPPPAAPMSDHRGDRPCHSKVAGQTHVCVFGAGRTYGSRP